MKTNVDAQISLAISQAESGNYEAAQKELSAVLKRAPNSAKIYFELSKLAQQSKASVKDIHQLCLKAVELSPDSAEYNYELGKSLLTQERYDEARKYLDIAHSIEPENPAILAGLVAVSVKQGEMNFAFEQIEKLQDRKIYIPIAALSFLLCCKHDDRCEEAIEYANNCLKDKSLSQRDRLNIHSKLASVLDYKQQYDSAWENILVSKNFQVAPDSYDAIVHKAYIDNLIETFTFANMFKLPRSDVESQHAPVFILGMPRSGTSLLEQILTAHPRITGGGELNYIQDIVYELPQLLSSPQTWPFCVLDMKQLNSNSLTERYLNKISKIAENTQLVTDKMPHNFYYVGLIKLLFPKAKIIHCRRNPLDTCISICFQNFKEGHEYSKNLFNLGAHYHQYLRLMEHWKKSLSIDMLEVDYEVIVNEPEKKIREILDYCDLEWNKNCLQFNKVERYVITASFDQVRQPLYTRSINRWKHYESYLDDIKDGLERGF